MGGILLYSFEVRGNVVQGLYVESKIKCAY